MLEQNNLGTPRPKRLVSAYAWCDWKIMMLAVDMRPGASPHIKVWQNGNCKVRLAVACMHMCHWIYIDIVLVGHQISIWHCYSTQMINGNYVPTKYGYVIQFPNHTWVQCPSWRNAPISGIVQVWPDSDQKRTAVIPHGHEHNNHCDSKHSLPCAFI
jgi:hypothetical protein